MTVVVIVADGARPDSMAQAMDSGIAPALARLRDEGGLHTVTSVFPSVTGPAYAPFVMGRYPGPVGLPGLRWYDRERRTSRLPGNSRSYVGPELRLVDTDLDSNAPTIFELVPSSIGALNVIGRGLPRKSRIGSSAGFAARTGLTHFRGKVTGWLGIDREIAAEVTDRIRAEQPDFVFAALTGIDKTSHAEGHTGAIVTQAMRIVNDTVAEIREDAERKNVWDAMHLWVVSDHGHSPVLSHEDLAGIVREMGFRTIAHPFVYSTRGEAAVMVSGNAMAHVYLDVARRERPYLRDLNGRWQAIGDGLIQRESVDLMILPVSPGACEVHARSRGYAAMTWNDGAISYRTVTGDPLGIGDQSDLQEADAYALTRETDYPDSLVQISCLCDSPRSGEIILSAARNWDFRAKYEPIPHESSHGALHRDHMLVPLLLNRAPRGVPRRTVDVMPSALVALGITPPQGLDGQSFI
ncbi:MAG TPA: alkaline phosphatase family protein [Gemmatimonadaceae bacterium]|nr:alkaline phosphatase family protein [Gemmatimonadaceae bacterium]